MNFLVMKITHILISPPHLRSKNYKIASKKSYPWKGFSTIVSTRALPNFLKIFILHFEKKILWQICSIFNNSYTIGLNISKPPWCTPTHQRLSNNTKITTEGTIVWDLWEISMWQTKQNKTNKQSSLIDRLTY